MIDKLKSMRYQITIEIPEELNPMSPNHTEALFHNPNNRNQIKVLDVIKLDYE